MKLTEKQKKDIANLYWCDQLTMNHIKSLKRYANFSEGMLRNAINKYIPYKFNERTFVDIEMKSDNDNYWMNLTEQEHLDWLNKRNLPPDEETLMIFRIGRYFRTLNDEHSRI